MDGLPMKPKVLFVLLLCCVLAACSKEQRVTGKEVANILFKSFSFEDVTYKHEFQHLLHEKLCTKTPFFLMNWVESRTKSVSTYSLDSGEKNISITPKSIGQYQKAINKHYAAEGEELSGYC